MEVASVRQADRRSNPLSRECSGHEILPLRLHGRAAGLVNLTPKERLLKMEWFEAAA